jgi:hypothetical protein
LKKLIENCYILVATKMEIPVLANGRKLGIGILE